MIGTDPSRTFEPRRSKQGLAHKAGFDSPLRCLGGQRKAGTSPLHFMSLPTTESATLHKHRKAGIKTPTGTAPRFPKALSNPATKVKTCINWLQSYLCSLKISLLLLGVDHSINSPSGMMVLYHASSNRKRKLLYCQPTKLIGQIVCAVFTM